MCRNIKTLHNFKPPATEEEIRASSVQFVRKLSGFTKPSKANEAVFNRAVDEVAQAAVFEEGDAEAVLVLLGARREAGEAEHHVGRRVGVHAEELAHGGGGAIDASGRPPVWTVRVRTTVSVVRSRAGGNAAPRGRC